MVTTHRTKNKCRRKFLYSVHFSTSLSLCASHCMPASGHSASLQSWHNQSEQSGRRRAVLVDERRRLTSEDLLLITICLLGQSHGRGAQATAASDSVRAFFSGGEGTRRKMARCQANMTHTFANTDLHTVSRTFRMP